MYLLRLKGDDGEFHETVVDDYEQAYQMLRCSPHGGILESHTGGKPWLEQK